MEEVLFYSERRKDMPNIEVLAYSPYDWTEFNGYLNKRKARMRTVTSPLDDDDSANHRHNFVLHGRQIPQAHAFSAVGLKTPSRYIAAMIEPTEEEDVPWTDSRPRSVSDGENGRKNWELYHEFPGSQHG